MKKYEENLIKEIVDAWVHLRKTNQTISDEAIDFMKQTSLDKLKTCDMLSVDEDNDLFLCGNCNYIININKDKDEKYCYNCGTKINKFIDFEGNND